MVWNFTLSGATPAALAASSPDFVGHWVPAQTSTPSAVTEAVQLRGSICA